MERVTKIVNLEHNKQMISKAGKPYTATVLTVEGVKTPYNLFTDHPLINTVQQLTVGNTIKLTTGKDGLFVKINAIEKLPDGTPLQLEAPSYTGGFTKNSPFDGKNKGMQVGNAINNAVLLFVSGKMEGTLEDIALEVLKLNDTLFDQVTGGVVANIQTASGTTGAAAPTNGASEAFNVVDEEIPF